MSVRQETHTMELSALWLVSEQGVGPYDVWVALQRRQPPRVVYIESRFGYSYIEVPHYSVFVFKSGGLLLCPDVKTASDVQTP